MATWLLGGAQRLRTLVHSRRAVRLLVRVFGWSPRSWRLLLLLLLLLLCLRPLVAILCQPRLCGGALRLEAVKGRGA